VQRIPKASGREVVTRTAIPLVRANAWFPFIEFLRGIGYPVERRLGEARLTQAILSDPEALVPAASAYRFLELASRHERIEGLGVVVGQRFSAFDLGTYGAALREASTVHEYLRLGAALLGGHSSGTDIWLRKERDALRVCQSLRGPAGPGRCIADLFTLVITLNTLRRFIGKAWCPIELQLVAGVESMLGDPDVFGDARVITGARYTSFTIAMPELQQRVHASPGVAETRPHHQAPADFSIPVDLKGSLEALIVTLMPDGGPSIRVAAEMAGLSPRTLQRRLAEAGSSYSELLASARIRTAKRWLSESSMTVTEVSASLGYREPSNFARRFRSSTGLSPTAYRAMYRQA
jgi:AraC-like DNA-binding protein